MIATKVKTKDETKKVLAKAKQGNFKSLGHAGAAIRLTAKRSIRKRKKASPERAAAESPSPEASNAWRARPVSESPPASRP